MPDIQDTNIGFTDTNILFTDTDSNFIIGFYMVNFVDTNVIFVDTAVVFSPHLTYSIQVLPLDYILPFPNTQQFIALQINTDGTKTDITSSVTWHSTNSLVAVIDSSGLATAVGEGSTAITATYSSIIGFTILIITTQAAIALTPTMYLSWSDDGGHTWSSDYGASIGQTGQRKTRVIWRRLGYSRDRVFRIMCADKIKKRIIGCIVE